MAVNNEYIRLNRYKRPERYWVQDVPEKSVPNPVHFAHDLSLNPEKGETVDYKSINDSITIIILSNFGEHIFRPRLGSSAQTQTFEIIQKGFSWDLAAEIENIETRIKVLNVSTFVDPDNHSLILTIPYMVLDTGETGEYSQRLAM